MADLPVINLEGQPADAGRAHARVLGDILDHSFREAYLLDLGAITRTGREDLRRQAERWLGRLPDEFRLEIEGMACGSSCDAIEVAEFLYADIAAPTRTAGAPRSVEQEIAGPMCSAATVTLGQRRQLVARNCDWLSATLRRGAAVTVHSVPHRIPVMALGIRGDIDVDTGINAEGLWLHLHTMPALDDPPQDRTIISWLFWARQALETCASIDELERFIASTGRDRGVIVVACEGGTGHGAVFECGRATHERHDRDGPWQIATNHKLSLEIDEARESRSRCGSTIARYCGLRRAMRDGAADDATLMGMLGREDVEMRTPEHLRTIYSAVFDPARAEGWFAWGDESGRPAASRGSWTRVRAPF